MKEVYVTTIRKILGPEPTCYCPKRREEIPSELCLRCDEFVGDSGCIYGKEKFFLSSKRK